jgi:hypothetical protein
MKKIFKKWRLRKPEFEFITDLPIESSAWSGHYFFAYDLVAATKPKVIVELGTHKGNSLFSFAQAIKDFELKTKIHAVDTWEGDEHAGFYGEDVYKTFLDIKNRYYEDVNIIPHKMLFDKAIEDFDDNTIDILHIDGLHTYNAVKHDFETWLPKVKKKTGIILFHDVCEKSDDFGVYKLWEELKKKYKTITFGHYHGLGVLFLNEGSSHKNLPSPEILITYYKKVSETQDLNKALNDKDIHIDNLERKTLELLKGTKVLTNQNKELTNQNKELTNQNKELTNQNKELTNQNKEVTNQNKEVTNQNKELTNQNKDLNNILSDKNEALEKIYNSKSWKLTQPVREFTKMVRDFKNRLRK